MVSNPELGLLVPNWSRVESTTPPDRFWGDGRRVFSEDEILRHMENDRILEAKLIISSEQRRVRAERYQGIAEAMGVRRDLLTSLKTRRHFRSSPFRGGLPDPAA